MSETKRYLPQFAACRDLGHQWDYFQWVSGKRTLVCDNCDTKRFDVMDGRFAIISRKYVYPKGYGWNDVAIPVKILRKQLKREARKLTRWVGPKSPHLMIVKRRANAASSR